MFKWIVVSLTVMFVTFISFEASAKRIIISIDGTNNAPKDAEDDYEGIIGELLEIDEKLKDESISNVFKVHLLSGGTFPNELTDTDGDGQISLYYIGVGNADVHSPLHIFKRIDAKLEAVIAKDHPEEILKKAFSDLQAVYEAGDEIYIFGFSRGAATARELAQVITGDGFEKNGEQVKPDIRFLGIWDTVIASGMPDLNSELSPEALEPGSGVINKKVREVVHLLAIDEFRRTFRPTLVTPREGVTEVWFSGAHSDVGGGYLNDGLSDITLEFMLDRATGDGMMSKISPEQAAANMNEEFTFDIDRLVIDANPESELHYPGESKTPNLLAARKIKVISGESKPLIHSSVEKRLGSVERYKPTNIVDGSQPPRISDNFEIVD